MIYGDRLYGTASIYYDAQNTQRLSHFSRSLQLNQSSFSGWSRVWDQYKTGYVSGAMSVIPSEWRTLLGGPAATGQCCIPVVGRTSWGPAAFAFNPAEVGAPTVPASPLLYYTGEHPTLGQWDGSNPTYGATIQMGGLAIIAGTRTALYFGRNGVGPNCYGNGTSDQSLDGTKGPDGALWCYDPTSTDKGSHAYPYRYQIWAYDLADFAAVKAGTKAPWDVKPYGVWPFDLPTPEAMVKLGGVGYDSANQVLYLSQMFADRDGYSYRPVIHALQINKAGVSPLPTPPPPPPPSTTTPGTISADTASIVVRTITLAVNRTAPQMVATPIKFTATATGGATPQEFKWLLFDGTSWKPLTPWSTTNVYTWTPATASAVYRVGVWARSAGNTADDAEASASTPFPITAPDPVPVRSVSIAANKTAPQAAGTTITWTATVTGGAMLQYKWLLHDGGSWSAVTGWTTQNTFNWTPAAANANYRIGIWVRSNGSTSEEPEATASEDFAISGATTTTTPTPTPTTTTTTTTTVTTRLTEVTLSTNLVAPQSAGTTIAVTATPNGGTAHTFRWLIHDGNQWNIVGDWTTSNTFAWTPAKADPNYRLGVWVRNGGNTSSDPEVTASLDFPIK
jgi:hypothetical protein